MLRFAIIENDEVVNVIVADAQFIKTQKLSAVECSDEVSCGWKYINKEFISPPIIFSPELKDETIPR